MQHQPDFLQRELIELGVAQELLKPHTTIVSESSQALSLPGALIENCRRNRGLDSAAPEVGPASDIPTPAMVRLIDEEIRRRQSSRFAVFEIFYARGGVYDSSRQTGVIVPMGRWTRVRIPLEHPSEGGPLRIDPCDCPALIEIASIALRQGPRIAWQVRRDALGSITLGGDAIRMRLGRILIIRSVGNDPMIFLPPELAVRPPFVLDCWIRLRRDDQ